VSLAFICELTLQLDFDVTEIIRCPHSLHTHTVGECLLYWLSRNTEDEMAKVYHRQGSRKHTSAARQSIYL